MTIKDYLNRAANESPEAAALKYKQDGVWETMNYCRLREGAWHVAEMLVRLGVNEGDRVALCRENSPEWFEIYHGIVGIGAVAVPVDVKLRKEEMWHVFRNCEVSAVFASSRFAAVLTELRKVLPGLCVILMTDSIERNEILCSKKEHYTYKTLWKQVAETALSDRRIFDCISPSASSPASFIYTSGTTGLPKGAVLTHRNFLSNVHGILEAIRFRKSENVALILPLHHSFAFTTTVLIPVCVQCQVTIIEHPKTIKADMAETAPTVLLAVPLLLEKMLDRALKAVNQRVAGRLMYKYGLAKVIGHRIRASMGGMLRLIVSGGAPINPATLRAWSRLGFCIIEGYGITETAPVLCVNRPGKVRIGTVGPPLKNVQMQIENLNAEGSGEIVVRGENVMQGYYNNPEETAKALVNGWYHTGDLGYFDEQGYLVISGREKNLIVNREGKNIYPEEVERQVLKSRYVLECLVTGYRNPGETGERVSLIAVPNQEVFDQLMQPFSNEQIEQMLFSDIRKHMSALSAYKRPRRMEIRFEPFEKTTTQKIKRHLYTLDP